MTYEERLVERMITAGLSEDIIVFVLEIPVVDLSGLTLPQQESEAKDPRNWSRSRLISFNTAVDLSNDDRFMVAGV